MDKPYIDTAPPPTAPVNGSLRDSIEYHLVYSGGEALVNASIAE